MSKIFVTDNEGNPAQELECIDGPNGSKIYSSKSPEKLLVRINDRRAFNSKYFITPATLVSCQKAGRKAIGKPCPHRNQRSGVTEESRESIKSIGLEDI